MEGNVMETSYLRLWRLTKTFPSPSGGTSTVVKDFDLTLDEGEFACLIGHSGCGKSTVLSMVAGLTPLTNGRMYLAEQQIYVPGPDRGMVFQSPCLLPWMTALQNVQLGVDQV